MRYLATLTLLLSLCLSLGAQEDWNDAALTERGKSVLQNLKETKGGEIYHIMSQQMKAALDEPKLNSIWVSLLMQLGDFKQDSEWEIKPAAGMKTVLARLDFEKGALQYVATFTTKGILSGLFFSPLNEKKKERITPEQSAYFTEKEISIRTGNFTLPGLLTLPNKQNTNTPCVILVHGSGPQDMNETANDIRPFRDLAHGLAKEGIAVIRYNKRTYVYGNQSATDPEGITLNAEVTDDVRSAIQLACTTKGIDPKRIFVIGHSLGAMLAPMIATENPQLKGIVMMAGNAGALEDILIDQLTYIHKLGVQGDLSELIKEIGKQVANLKKIDTPAFDASIPLPLNVPAIYWKQLMQYDQQQTAAALSTPMLLLNGEGDYQVPMSEFEKWKSALKRKKNASFISYPGLGHFFTAASPQPSPKDYDTPGNIPDYVIQDIAKWINKQK